jgi:SAM-dependent methyltransferase
MLQDKSILEIGPGDNVGIAIKFLVAGAKQVVCLDKFFSMQDWEQQCSIYQALREQLNSDEQQIFDDVIDLEHGIVGDRFIVPPDLSRSKTNSSKLVYMYGSGIEEAEELFEPESFDLIISRAVFEHVYDPDAAFSVMHTLLKPDGYMLHKIDFRDHGIFSKHKHHPLTFLTIPDPIYRLMVYDSGKPNRKLVSYYRKKTKELGLDAKILITHLVGVESEIIPHKETVSFGIDYGAATLTLLNSIRPHLQDEFKHISDEDLMISGIFLIAQRNTSCVYEEPHWAWRRESSLHKVCMG